MAIVDVVKYNGGPDIFAWKYPSEELGTWTQLIVNESQEAILFKGGKALDIFQSGRHTLETKNIPFLNKIINLPFGGRSPFTAEVWFINKAFNLDIKWGTPSPIQIQDPKYGIFAPVRSHGAFGIQIEDSKKFIVKLVGTVSVFDKNSITKYFKSLYITKVKDSISEYLVKNKISILEINAYIDELSSYMKERIEPIMSDYGVSLVNFYVNDISVPEEDPAIKKLKDALARKAEMDIIGYNYQQERSFDTLEGAAKNTGSTAAPLMGAGLGLGMGLGMGRTVGDEFGGISQEITTSGNSTATKKCSNCHATMPSTQKFCGVCGFDTSKDSAVEETILNPICSKCNAKISSKDKFCPECGNKLNLCPKCGTDIIEGSSSCSKCGYEIPKKCPNCASEIPSNVKFCPECGTSLVKHCDNCNAVIDETDKFCPECGNKLGGN
ncbi:SPFH domain-containing protein [Miniphocaeibacter massiliensis]|uniref:SPFH domain-containing protein n=1 Tax=Miniphocaeibacter massiliensis TaxID=2041841 RepID=UPI000C1C613C|nr:SPFH domain-containing protein [Miniphocaeibacter massiliensis]